MRSSDTERDASALRSVICSVPSNWHRVRHFDRCRKYVNLSSRSSRCDCGNSFVNKSLRLYVYLLWPPSLFLLPQLHNIGHRQLSDASFSELILALLCFIHRFVITKIWVELSMGTPNIRSLCSSDLVNSTPFSSPGTHYRRNLPRQRSDVFMPCQMLDSQCNQIRDDGTNSNGEGKE